jgi:hypothetical protein
VEIQPSDGELVASVLRHTAKDKAWEQRTKSTRTTCHLLLTPSALWDTSESETALPFQVCPGDRERRTKSRSVRTGRGILTSTPLAAWRMNRQQGRMPIKQRSGQGWRSTRFCFRLPSSHDSDHRVAIIGAGSYGAAYGAALSESGVDSDWADTPDGPLGY